MSKQDKLATIFVVAASALWLIWTFVQLGGR